METFSSLLACCARNSPVTSEFPTQRPVTRKFDVFFDPRLNQQLSKQWRRRWFETPSHSLWRQCNDYIKYAMTNCVTHKCWSVIEFTKDTPIRMCFLVFIVSVEENIDLTITGHGGPYPHRQSKMVTLMDHFSFKEQSRGMFIGL